MLRIIIRNMRIFRGTYWQCNYYFETLFRNMSKLSHYYGIISKIVVSNPSMLIQVFQRLSCTVHNTSVDKRAAMQNALDCATTLDYGSLQVGKLSPFLLPYATFHRLAKAQRSSSQSLRMWKQCAA